MKNSPSLVKVYLERYELEKEVIVKPQQKHFDQIATEYLDSRSGKKKC